MSLTKIQVKRFVERVYALIIPCLLLGVDSRALAGGCKPGKQDSYLKACLGRFDSPSYADCNSFANNMCNTKLGEQSRQWEKQQRKNNKTKNSDYYGLGSNSSRYLYGSNRKLYSGGSPPPVFSSASSDNLSVDQMESMVFRGICPRELVLLKISYAYKACKHVCDGADYMMHVCNDCQVEVERERKIKRRYNSFIRQCKS